MATEYAKGAASDTMTAEAATDRATLSSNRPATSSSVAVATPPIAMTARSQGSHPSARVNSTHARTDVTSTVPASAVAAGGRDRFCHSRVAPIPTSAATAGASATV